MGPYRWTWKHAYAFNCSISPGSLQHCNKLNKLVRITCSEGHSPAEEQLSKIRNVGSPVAVKMKSFYPILAILVLVQSISSERILVLTPLGSKSHKNVFDPLIDALAAKGHKVTTAVPYKSSKLHPNVREYVPSVPPAFSTMTNPFDLRRAGTHVAFAFNMSKIAEISEMVYREEGFQDIISQQYDLVIMNAFVNSYFDCIIHRQKVPHILVTSMPAPSFVTMLTGNHLPLSFVPNPTFAFSDRMSFWERTINVGFDLFVTHVLSRFFWFDVIDGEGRKVLGDDCPDYYTTHRNASLLLMNSHFSLTYPRPNLPDNVEVGGMHCRPTKPLPKDLEEYLSGAEQGFVYFSLGSIVQAKEMPQETKNTFLRVFSKLKQKVIWKWEGEMEGLPPNVRINKWLPQQDILGHKNIRLFITHGGLLSTQEAIYHGVPLLGLPLFADQDLNIKQAEQKGYALTSEIVDLDEKDFEAKLNRLLDEPSFSQKAKYLSSVFRDQTETPLERAVFWVEYVLRHGGAPHLRSAARDLNYFQVHSFDVLGFMLAVLILIIASVVCSCKFLCRRVCGSRKSRAAAAATKSSKKHN